jgi:CrcB protein
MLRECLAVAIGGALGSLGRYALLLMFSLLGAGWLPLATLVANVIGCLAIGWVAQWALHQDAPNAWWLVGIRIGLLGGLTTFSSFALDVWRMGQSEKLGLALLLAATHVCLGIACVALGMSWAKPATAG